MPREPYSDLVAFLTVARERSFTRAAAQLGVSQSALSHAVRALETRIGVRLLTRTTRSVAPTEAGASLLASVGPKLDDIADELDRLRQQQSKPAGTVRINAGDYAARTVIWPKIARLLPDYPGLVVETVIDNSLADIVSGRFDLGVRFGDQVAKDMVAVRVAPDCRMVIVGSPSYLHRRPAPRSPRELAEHECVNLRLQGSGGLYAWELAQGGRELPVRVEGRLIFNSVYPIVDAVLHGFGLGFVPDDLVRDHVAHGRLRYVLEDWFPTWPGLHCYSTSRRQPSRALSLVIDALRHHD